MMSNETMLHLFKLPELFLTFNTKALKIKGPTLREIGYSDHKDVFATTIFAEVFEIILNDIIENGTQFMFANSEWGSAYLCMQRITNDDYIISRQRGAFKDFDPLETDFSAYRIEYCAERKNGVKFASPLHLDSKHNKRIAELAKAHKLKAGKVKTYQDYYPELLQKYSNIPKQDIYRILRFGFNSFRLHMSYGGDILIRANTFRIQTGKVFRDNYLMMQYVMEKAKIKIRVLYRRLHYLWDGYSYFSLTEERYNEIIDNYKKHKVVNYGEVVLHKCYDEAIMNALYRKALFKVKAGDPNTRFSNMEILSTDKAELIEVFDKWDWSTVSLNSRNYMTLFSYVSHKLKKIYKQNYGPYIKWLRARRWKNLRR